MLKTLGGDRLGSGKKIQVNLHNFGRSTHDLGYIWRSSMSSGTLVPFLTELALPGDTFDIELDCNVMTHPTVGPLFGSFKIQLDVFQAPIRLYQAVLHNNQLGIGLAMNTVLLPQLELEANAISSTQIDIDNSQINPSALLSYLNIRGVGTVPSGTQARNFNAITALAYWEIYKNYYANKQEEVGAVIHNKYTTPTETVDNIIIIVNGTGTPLTLYPTTTSIDVNKTTPILIQYTGTVPNPNQIIIQTQFGDLSLESISQPFEVVDGVLTSQGFNNAMNITSWRYISTTDIITGAPNVVTFPLSNIDDMRSAILQTPITTQFTINSGTQEPYNWLVDTGGTNPSSLNTQEGLAVKTYQSDLFNNWIQTEWLDGSTGINAITAVDTSTGHFNIDTLILSEKVYKMLMRIAVSGGSYDDWLDAVYTHERYTRCESPMYCGGLSKELAFNAVVSTMALNSAANETFSPLGTLGGRGQLTKKHKGGKMTIKVDEPSYIIGIVSLTPRIDYSQGNKWDTHLNSMDDLHKPSLDEIGFQDLLTEQMAWWDTAYNGTVWEQQSAGKQPAWINYMTNVNQTRGNFAIANNEMFMTLNRRYEAGEDTHIADLTTYIDPAKFNFIFAQTSLDAQNFWCQIAVDNTARRKMSAKVMPNL